MSTSFSISSNVNTEAARKTIAQNAHGFTVGTPVRRTSGSYVAAQGDSLANSLCDGIVTGVPDVNSFDLTSNGYASGLSGFTDGDQYYLDPDSAGATVTTRTSTAGQFIKPLFKAISATEIIVLIGESEEVVAPAGGGLVLLQSRDLTNQANMVFDTTIDSTYDNYCIKLDYVIPISAGANFLMFTSTDTGSSYETSYRYVFKQVTTAPADTNDSNAGASNILLGNSVGATPAAGEEGVCGTVELFNPSKATTYRHMKAETMFVNTSSVFVYRTGFAYTAINTPLNAVKFEYSTGNLTGKGYLYGIVKS
jgi:hypothetical protein